MSQPSWIGYQLSGRYQIEEMLGQGGMSAVYRATDPNLRRVVAVKLIHAHLSNDSDFVRRFEIEAAVVASLRHPNIVQVFDFNHDGDTYYMILEFIPGETLQQRLRRFIQNRRQMALPEVIDIAATIADAVDYAHKQGMIHRDIKPANVMINLSNQAILTDFGIAKILGGTQHTATGAVVGTALYMAPEQAQGRPPDERSDIYALGVMLFEMISGRPPFEGDSAMTILLKHVTDPVPDLRLLNPDTPPDLQRIVEKALAKNPTERFQSASAIAAALRSVDFLRQADMIGAATFVEPPMATMVEPAPAYAPSGYAAQVPLHRGETRQGQESLRHERPAKKGGDKTLLIGAGLAAVLLVICLGVAALAFGGPLLASLLPGGGDAETAEPATPTLEGDSFPTDAPTPLPQSQTEQPGASTAAPTNSPVALSPTPAQTATPTVPPGLDYYVWITQITLDGNTYVVAYETFGFTESLPNAMHVHFFFDTVPPAQAGSPGGGPWFLYGGPRPFRGYTTSSKPASAIQMCARVANHDHSLYDVNSGNCVDLPTVAPTATP